MLLEVDELRLGFPDGENSNEVVRGVSMSIDRGEIVGLVGESGSGKTLTALSIMGLLPDAGERLGGEIRLDGVDLEGLEEKDRRGYRGARIGLVFQEPEAALNPVFTIGYLLSETLREHRPSLNRREIRREAIGLLELVAIPDPVERLAGYSYELSGGQRQRVMIALALAGSPDLLLLDEPTAALDVTLQAQILSLLLELRQSLDLAILLITHDLSIVASTCDRAMVMYAGQIVESGTTEEVLGNPGHPYSKGLLAALPQLGQPMKRGQLPSIRGSIFDSRARPGGCAFHPRCPEALPECALTDPELILDERGRWIRCILERTSS